MKKLPLGIQSFRRVIKEDYIYVDKTQYIYNLINEASFYFLSRPRRFGKSLLLDTIAEVFSGDKELFKGLYIYDSGYTFQKHPVLRLDMSNIANKTPGILENEILIELTKRAESEGFMIQYESPSAVFKTLIEKLREKYDRRVVVLIDEYDKPILDHIDDLTLADANRNILRNVYGVLKSMDPHLQFTFITGVTKFTKTSVFSGLNNLRDITMLKKYANICGIATEDLTKYFGEHIEHISALEEFGAYSNVESEILTWYDGYSWDGKTRVINPYSLLNFFSDEKFSGFWYSTGTPTFLIDLIKRNPEGYTSLNNLKTSEWELDVFDIDRIEVGPMLFQTGYLTVEEVVPTPAPAVYRLGIPNYEVRLALNLQILAEFTESGVMSAGAAYRNIKESLETGDLQGMLETMRRLFSSIPYQLHISHESYYHSIFYAIMNLLGFNIDAEVSVSGGRIDAVLELRDKVYVVEFKYQKSGPDVTDDEKRTLFDNALKEGMSQIEDRGYTKKFAGCGKDIYRAAFVFLGRSDIDMRYTMS